MGTHPKSLQLFDWNRRDCDIWLFNEAPTAKNDNGEPKFPQADAVFQLHHEAIWKNPKNRSDEKHYQWLKSGKTPTIYMQEAYPEIPKAVRYPIEKVLSLVKNVRMVIDGKEKTFKYLSSSPDFAFALVAHMWKKGQRYKEVEVYGIELATESEYSYQRTGFGFWIGYLSALGIKIKLYNSIFNQPIYGYEGDVAISSIDFEKRIAKLTSEIGNDKDQYIQDAKVFLESLPELLKKDVSREIEKGLQELTKKGEKTSILNGRIQENNRYLEKARAMEEVSGASIFSPGEFDGARVAYNKQILQVRSEAVNLNANINFLLKKLLNMRKGSKKRRKAVDEFGNFIAELLNKNMLIFHIAGSIEENQYWINAVKQSIKVSIEET